MAKLTTNENQAVRPFKYELSFSIDEEIIKISIESDFDYDIPEKYLYEIVKRDIYSSFVQTPGFQEKLDNRDSVFAKNIKIFNLTKDAEGSHVIEIPGSIQLFPPLIVCGVRTI